MPGLDPRRPANAARLTEADQTRSREGGTISDGPISSSRLERLMDRHRRVLLCLTLAMSLGVGALGSGEAS